MSFNHIRDLIIEEIHIVRANNILYREPVIPQVIVAVTFFFANAKLRCVAELTLKPTVVTTNKTCVSASCDSERRISSLSC